MRLAIGRVTDVEQARVWSDGIGELGLLSLLMSYLPRREDGRGRRRGALREAVVRR
jgi:hypothetical protein